MRVPSTQISVNVSSPQGVESSSPVLSTSTGTEKIQAPKKLEAAKPEDVTKGEDKKRTEAPKTRSHSLVEIQGNPRATAAKAAQVARELKPPTNPYPTVQELLTVKRAQAMERAALDKMKEQTGYEGVDRRV